MPEPNKFDLTTLKLNLNLEFKKELFYISEPNYKFYKCENCETILPKYMLPYE